MTASESEPAIAAGEAASDAPTIDGFDLAPAAIVRIAGWPLDTITRFRPERLGDPAGPSADAEYQAELEKQRATLRALTVGDPGFMRALAVAHPTLAARVLGCDWSRRTKRVRHLETTLYRYLARAAGNPTPGDYWAAASLATWGAATSLAVDADLPVFSPDLRPFQAILLELGTRRAYRRRGTFRPNATLTRVGDGSWSYWWRLPPGTLIERRVGAKAASFMTELADRSARRYAELVSLCARHFGCTHLAAEHEIDACIDAGVLVGGLDLPSRFDSPWDALAGVEKSLAPAERAPWRHCAKALGEIAEQLGLRFGGLGAAEILTMFERARAEILALAERCQVAPPPIPRLVFHCDRTATEAGRLGPELREQVASLGPELEAELALFGRLLARRAKALGWLRKAEAPLGLGECLSQMQQGEREGEGSGAGGAADDEVDRAPPFGSLVLGCVTSDRPELRFMGTCDSMTSPCSRIHALVERATPGTTRVLREWIREALAAVAESAGVRPVELIAPFESNPNVRAGPAWCDDTVALWGASVGSVQLPGLGLFIDRRRGGLPLARARGEARPIALMEFSAANRSQDDPLTRLLLQTSPGLHEDEAPLPHPAEGRHPLARPRRTAISGDVWSRLIESRGLARHRLWRELAREHEWGELLWVRAGRRSGLLIHRDSPLGLDAVLEGARAKGPPLIVEMPYDLTSLSGRVHLAEVVIPFARARHVWLPADLAPEKGEAGAAR